MSPGVRKRISIGLINDSNGGDCADRCSITEGSRSCSLPAQKRRHSSRIHDPAVCFVNRTVPPGYPFRWKIQSPRFGA
jgi:hypothetical protein